MKMNPVYKREMMVSARSFRMALILMVFNGILAVVALLNMYSMLEQVKLTAEIQYSGFIDLYLFVAVLEFIMLILIMPALTAGSISEEKERRTLELMMTTKLTPCDIILGKLQAVLSTMLMIILSSLPILCLVFVYGGVTWKDLLLLFVSYMSATLFVGGISIFCSACFDRTTVATVVSYVMIALTALGTYGVNWFAVYINQMHMNAVTAAVRGTETIVTSGKLVGFLLVNPTTAFVLLMMRLTGHNPGMSILSAWFGNRGMQDLDMVWIVGSITIQLLTAAVLAAASVRAITPGKKLKV